MGQSADQIRNEIDMNRRNASDKIDQIQSQVEQTADKLRTGVQDSAQDVREQLKGTIDDTVETVKQSFDFRQQIEARPLVALGVALAGGFLLGGLKGDGDQHHGGNGSSQHVPGQASGGSSIGQGVRSAMQKSGLDDTISNAASALIGSVTDQLRDTLDRNFPGFADKMQTAQQSGGDVADKTRQAQSTNL